MGEMHLVCSRNNSEASAEKQKWKIGQGGRSPDGLVLAGLSMYRVKCYQRVLQEETKLRKFKFNDKNNLKN
jgi:hypothetical protein